MSSLATRSLTVFPIPSTAACTPSSELNGLGKTTLLAMLYRALMGPYDQSKRDDAGLLSSKHEVSGWRDRDFFRERVSDGAANATVEVDVAFGDHLVYGPSQTKQPCRRPSRSRWRFKRCVAGRILRCRSRAIGRGDLFRFLCDSALLSLLPRRPH